MIAVVASYAACCVQPNNPKTKMSNSLQLAANFALSGHDLVLDYQVVNHDRRDVYLLNRLSRSGRISPDVIYVHLDEATETILLSKKVADLPDGLSPTSPVAPFVSPVRAGAKFSEQVRVPVPVHCYHQYLSTDESRGEMKRFRYVRFKLGYYWRPPGATERTQSIGGVAVILPIFAGRPEFGELETKRIAIEVPVIVPR
jgi:hypothetical protein